MRRMQAFTVIELIFVIVVLGILASIAVPRFSATRDDAVISKGRAQVAAIRSAIMTIHQMGILQGQSNWPTHLDNANTNTNQPLFGGIDENADGTVETLLSYPLFSNTTDGSWMKGNQNGDVDPYFFRVLGVNVNFDYNTTNQIFDCDHNNADCRLLTE